VSIFKNSTVYLLYIYIITNPHRKTITYRIRHNLFSFFSICWICWIQTKNSWLPKETSKFGQISLSNPRRSTTWTDLWREETELVWWDGLTNDAIWTVFYKIDIKHIWHTHIFPNIHILIFIHHSILSWIFQFYLSKFNRPNQITQKSAHQ
jgi:hypothetical protein